MSEETRGRKKKFSVDILREITKQYIEKGKTGSITASKLAAFAEELGYDNVKYYHFTRNSDELKDIIEFDKNGGRSKKYTVHDLKEIVEKCCEMIPDHEKFNVATLVKYAKKLGYKDITAYQFIKEPDIKELIDALKRDSSFLTDPDKEADFMLKHANILKADELVDAYKKDPFQLKLILRNYSKKYESLKLDYIKVSIELDKVKKELSQLEQLKEENKALKRKCEFYKNENTRMSKYDKLQNKLLVLEDLNEMGIKVNLSEEAFRALVTVDKRISDNMEDDNLKPGETANWFGEYSNLNTDSDNDDEVYASDSVVSFEDAKDKKIREADEFIDGFFGNDEGE